METFFVVNVDRPIWRAFTFGAWRDGEAAFVMPFFRADITD
jgi:hypothetical protein